MSTLNISLDTPLNLQTRWPTVSRGGGILWRPHSRTACSKTKCLPVSLEAGGGKPCRPNLAATLLLYIVVDFCFSTIYDNLHEVVKPGITIVTTFLNTQE